MSLLPEINQASAEINKFVAQANIHQAIAPVNPAEFTSPADTLLLASRDPVIREVSVGMTGEAYSEYSVSGTPPLSLPNSLGKPLKAWNVALSPYQDLHGYENPWPAGGGKNKFDYTAYQQRKVESGITFTVNTDGTVKANGIATGQCQIYWVIPHEVAVTLAGYVMDVFQSEVSGVTAMLEESGGSYTKYAAQTGGTGETISSTIADVETGVHFIIRVVSGTTLNNVVFYPMIRLANSTHAFAPYANLCPILGTDKLNLFVEESYDQSATPKAVIVMPDTLYGGTYDAVTGQGTIDRIYVDGGTLTWSKVTGSNYKTFKATIDGINYQYRVACVASSEYKAVSGYDASADEDNYVWSDDATHLAVKDTSKAELTDEQFKSSMVGVQFVYLIAPPIPFATDGHTIKLPKGTATTWATAEDGTVESMEVTYYKSE